MKKHGLMTIIILIFCASLFFVSCSSGGDDDDDGGSSSDDDTADNDAGGDDDTGDDDDDQTVELSLPANDADGVDSGLNINVGDEITVNGVLVDPKLGIMIRRLTAKKSLDPKVTITNAAGKQIAEGPMPFG